jgi:molybdenum cofactor cytidylyltransferase
MTAPLDADGIILAAGRARRFGAPKALLRVGGEPLLARLIRLCREAGLTRIVVVLGPRWGERMRATVELEGCRVVENPDQESMPLRSLQLALSALRPAARAVLHLPVDHPALQGSTIRTLLQTWRPEGKGILIPTWQGRRGHPVLWRREIIERLGDFGPGESPRTLLHRLPEEILEVPVEDPGILRNVNYPADIADLPGVELPGVELPGVDLPGVHLPGVDLPAAGDPRAAAPASASRREEEPE